MAPEKLYFQNAMSCRFDTETADFSDNCRVSASMQAAGNIQMKLRPRQETC
jgi:hypothetical protein